MTQIGRPADIEEWSNRYFIHKASDLLLPLLIRLRLTPNSVSVLGFLCALAAALLYYEALLSHVIFAIAGFGCALLWHIFDGSDGKLARATGQASEFGRVIDGICDHAAFTVIYVALCLAAIEQGYSAPISWTALGFAGLAHAYQAASFERRRQSYSQITARRIATDPKAPQAKGIFSGLNTVYSAAQKLGNGGLNDIETMMADNDSRIDALDQYKNLMPAHLRQWSLLSANHRTFLIFICVLLNMPLAYFLTEIGFLTMVHIWLLAKERKLAASLKTRLSL